MRKVRSFVLREGRLTEAQQQALETLWPRFGIERGQKIEPGGIFPRRGPLVLEIGFGGGEALLELARRHPEWNFLGIEVYRPGIGKLLQRLAEEGIENVRVIMGDAVEVLEEIAGGSFDRINIFFPDPWPKKRHHKRRLIQPPFVERLARKLKEGGLLHLATDWPDYAEQMWQAIEKSGQFEPIQPPERPVTKYEWRARKLGHQIFDLAFLRVAQAA